MKAVVCTQYGPPEGLEIKEIEKPEPGKNEILVKVKATTAHIGDTRIRRVDPFLVRLVFGLFKPKKNLVLGLEISGIVESAGKEVKSFTKGDEVFALTGFTLGGYAEYICLPADLKKGNLEKKGLAAIKPDNLDFEEAAAVPAAALTVLKNFQRANLIPGKKILINGASGSLGTYAIQMAKFFGTEVTAVCSGKNFGLVESLGADKMIDYTKEDFTLSLEKYDAVYDAVMKSGKWKCRKILKKGGVFLNNYHLSETREEDLLFIKELVEKNRLKPVIDRIYSINDIVEAHRYVDKGHKTGNVPVTIDF